MTQRLHHALLDNFLGNSPEWYKFTILGFLVANTAVVYVLGNNTLAGWMLIGEFIFTLAMALKCYPLQPGGLLAIQAFIMGLATPDTIHHEIEKNLPVILLLMFMVAGIYFMKELLLFLFTKILLNVRSKSALSLLFCLTSALLSAFLDALTVTAVIISVALGFYSVYHKVASGKKFHHDHDHGDDVAIEELHRDDLENFRAFLRSLMMHAAIGTALGGVCTIVGEPQNLLIAKMADWDFMEFFVRMSAITIPVLGVGLLTCLLLEKFKRFDYGHRLNRNVRRILEEYDRYETEQRTSSDVAKLLVQAVSAVVLVVGLSLHIIEVGLVGLAIIVLQTACNGVTEEHRIGKAFEEALPFTSLLVVFFTIVSVIHDQHLFSPVIEWVLSLDPTIQPSMFYVANGLLSAISDNVFVATVYISEVKAALDAGEISVEHFNKLAVAINTGTNLPSIATPNGQAAFLFLLTSALAPLIRLSYGKMVWMALPYTIVVGTAGFVAVTLTLGQ